MYFFDIIISKSDSILVYFVYFDFEMYFALQRHIFFRYYNFQKWSEHKVFFSLTNVFRVPTACTFSFLIWAVDSAPLLWSVFFYSSFLAASSQLYFSFIYIFGNLISKFLSIILYNKNLYIIFYISILYYKIWVQYVLILLYIKK